MDMIGWNGENVREYKLLQETLGFVGLTHICNLKGHDDDPKHKVSCPTFLLERERERERGGGGLNIVPL